MTSFLREERQNTLIFTIVSHSPLFHHPLSNLKGTSGRKKSEAQVKEREKCKKRAINDLNAPNGSRDISFQSRESGQDGHRHRRNTSRQ